MINDNIYIKKIDFETLIICYDIHRKFEIQISDLKTTLLLKCTTS